MTETTDRAALIAEAKRMSLYVQCGGPDDGTVYDRLIVALERSEAEAVRLLGIIEAAEVVLDDEHDSRCVKQALRILTKATTY